MVRLPVGYLSVLLLLLPLVTSGCRKDHDWQKELDYEVVREEMYDRAPRTQVDQWVVVSGRTTPQNMKNLLLARHDSIMARQTYQANPRPTNVYIYLFESEAEARRGGSGWLAMLEKRSDSGVSIRTNERTLTVPEQ